MAAPWRSRWTSAARMVKARVWRVDVGRTPLYLLDSNFKANSVRSREITSTLYGGDRDMRIRQEILLGVGGVRALKALGIEATVYHMNEGHSAFLIVERIRDLMASQRPHLRAGPGSGARHRRLHHPHPRPRRERTVRSGPAAKIPRFEDPVAGDPVGGVPRARPVRRTPRSKEFGMTVFALRSSAFANGVAKLHAETSRAMWKELWPALPEGEVPIRAITNGIHTRSWLSHEMVELYTRYFGPRFLEKPADHAVWERVEAIPPVRALADPPVPKGAARLLRPQAAEKPAAPPGRRDGAPAGGGGGAEPRGADDRLLPAVRHLQEGQSPFPPARSADPAPDEPGPAGADPLRRKGAPAGPPGEGDHPVGHPFRVGPAGSRPAGLPRGLRHQRGEVSWCRGSTCG